MVQVRSNVGRDAGQIIDLPYSVAVKNVAGGMARRVAGVHYGPGFPGQAPTEAPKTSRKASGARAQGVGRGRGR